MVESKYLLFVLTFRVGRSNNKCSSCGGIHDRDVQPNYFFGFCFQLVKGLRNSVWLFVYVFARIPCALLTLLNNVIHAKTSITLLISVIRKFSFKIKICIFSEAWVFLSQLETCNVTEMENNSCNGALRCLVLLQREFWICTTATYCVKAFCRNREPYWPHTYSTQPYKGKPNQNMEIMLKRAMIVSWFREATPYTPWFIKFPKFDIYKAFQGNNELKRASRDEKTWLRVFTSVSVFDFRYCGRR